MCDSHILDCLNSQGPRRGHPASSIGARIAHFRRLFDGNDVPTYKLAREALKGRFEWLETSSTVPLEEIYAPSLETKAGYTISG